MSNNLNDISKIYLDQVYSGKQKEASADVDRWSKKAAVEEEVGISSTDKREKAKKEALLRKKEQEAVDKEKKALKKESFSSWRTDLAEVIGPLTDTEDLKKVDEKKGIKNKVVINPKLTEAIGEIGG